MRALFPKHSWDEMINIGQNSCAPTINDIKKPRFRPVTNPENRPLRRPKRGVLSARYIVEPETASGATETAGMEEMLVDDPIEDFSDVEEGRSGWESEVSDDIESTSDWDREYEALRASKRDR